MTNEQLYSLNELKEMPDGTVFYTAKEFTLARGNEKGLPKVLVKSTISDTGETALIIGEDVFFWPDAEDDAEGSHDAKIFKVMGVIE